MRITFLRFFLAGDQSPLIEVQCLNVGVFSEQQLGQEVEAMEVGGKLPPKDLITQSQRADSSR